MRAAYQGHPDIKRKSTTTNQDRRTAEERVTNQRIFLHESWKLPADLVRYVASSWQRLVEVAEAYGELPDIDDYAPRAGLLDGETYAALVAGVDLPLPIPRACLSQEADRLVFSGEGLVEEELAVALNIISWALEQFECDEVLGGTWASTYGDRRGGGAFAVMSASILLSDTSVLERHLLRDALRERE